MGTIKVRRASDRVDQLLRDPDEYYRAMAMHAEARGVGEPSGRPRVPLWAEAGLGFAGLALVGVVVGIVGTLASDDDPRLPPGFVAAALVIPTVLSVAGIALVAAQRWHRKT